MSAAAPVALIESRIYLIRGQKVLLDFDLAALYQVKTRALNQAVRRNRERFPENFMFHNLNGGRTSRVSRFRRYLRQFSTLLKRQQKNRRRGASVFR